MAVILINTILLMKKISTCIYKLTLLLSFLSLAFFASAEEYKSMIRYDRVWECVSFENGDDVVKCMKFDGAEDINGKVYHKLISFKKALRIFDPEEGLWGYDIDDCVYQHEGYLRESDGVVYTLIKVCDDSQFPDCVGTQYIPQDNFSIPNTENLREHVLYDFNREIGDCYEALTFVGPGDYSGHACVVQFQVTMENIVDIDGVDYRSMQVACIDQNDGLSLTSHTYLEGIGAVDDGSLNYHEFYTQPLC